MNKNYKPTEAIRKNAVRALALTKKYNRSSDKVRIAKALVADELSLEDIKVLYRHLSKSKFANKTKEVDGGPAKEYLSDLLHGGTAALAWSRQILKNEGVLKSYHKDISESELNQEDSTELNSVLITKSLDEESKQATFVVMAPDEVDLHDDTYDAEEVRKACHSYNLCCRKASLLHLIETNSFSIAESYILPSDSIIGDTLIRKGTWVAVCQFHDDDIWQGVKEGEYTGLSIGAMARCTPIEQ